MNLPLQTCVWTGSPCSMPVADLPQNSTGVGTCDNVVSGGTCSIACATGLVPYPAARTCTDGVFDTTAQSCKGQFFCSKDQTMSNLHETAYESRPVCVLLGDVCPAMTGSAYHSVLFAWMLLSDRLLSDRSIARSVCACSSVLAPPTGGTWGSCATSISSGSSCSISCTTSGYINGAPYQCSNKVLTGSQTCGTSAGICKLTAAILNGNAGTCAQFKSGSSCTSEYR
jgi:hypothetical protein